MKIDQLPVEMLMKIFSFLPRYDEVTLVNKLFYDVACKVNDPKICVMVDKRFFEEHCLQSVRNSTRKISKIDIGSSIGQDLTSSTLPKIISIIRKFTASIKYLRIVCSIYISITEFMQILSLVPNVEQLIVGNLQIRAEKEQIFSNNDLDLHQLKKLHVWCKSPEFSVVFNRLPMGVLTELYLYNSNMNLVTILLKRQSNIKQLALNLGDYKTIIAVDILENLKLESLELQSSGYSHRDNSNIERILSKQTQLKSLELDLAEVDEHFMSFVASRFTKLETYSICVSLTPSVASIAKISKLNMLNDLSLTFIEVEDQLVSLAKLPNPAITTLRLYGGEYNRKLIRALANSVPNLKVLEFNTEMNTKISDPVMRNFNFIEVLVICGNQIFNGDNNESNDDDCFNQKLTVLIIINEFTLKTPFLNKLIAAYPNLKQLEILSESPISTVQFKRILNGFTKLESLNLRGAIELTMADLNYLKEHKNNLKFVSLGGLNVEFTDELKRQLSATFGMVICDNNGILHMAVDRETMDNERRCDENLIFT